MPKIEDDRTATATREALKAQKSCVLFVAFSPDRAARGAMLALAGDGFTVSRGTGDVARLTLADPHLSRRHAQLSRREGGWEVVDLGSHNGTMVNGQAIATAALADGDVVRCGGTLLVYREVTGEASFVPERGSPLVGQSFAMSALRAELDRAAAHDAPVLIDGESGVGKELAAEHIAARRSHKLVALNCASLTRELAESELFGHGAGAFTGADKARDGLFVSAHGGTLFLDEIGEMSLDLQAKLLRALATGTVRPVGTDQLREVDVHVVAATNRSLLDEVEAGRFRGDLYARIAAWSITIPPLRERREDIMQLAMHFLGAERAGLDYTPDAAQALVLHEWRYNVRELQNAVTVAAARAGGGPIDVKHLPPAVTRTAPAREAAPSAAPSTDTSAEPDADALRSVLAEHRGNVRKVAAALGRDRRHLYRLLEKHGIDPDPYRRPSKEDLLAALERESGSVARAAASFDTNRRQIYRWLEEYGVDIASLRDA